MSAVDDILAMRDKQAAPKFPNFGEWAAKNPRATKAMGHFGNALATGAGAGLASAAVTGVGMAASALYDAVSKARDFRGMMGSSFNADLHEFQRTRPVQFTEAYNSLRSLNPAITRDPMTAGTYMRRVMEMQPSAGGGILLESLNASKELLREGPLSAFQRHGATAAGSAISKRKEQQGATAAGSAISKRKERPRHGDGEEGDEEQGENSFSI